MPIRKVKIGENVNIPFPKLVNLYKCEIGDGCLIGPFVEIQEGAKIGEKSRIQSHCFICSKVKIGKEVFVGHGVVFINDKYPVNSNPKDWQETVVEDGAILGSNATILPCRIGRNALIGAGAVVTKDIPAGKVAVGNPAKIIGERK